MAKIRKLNVSETVGNNPTNSGDAIMPPGTIVVYENNNNGVIDYDLRIHDGVTDGGVELGGNTGNFTFNANAITNENNTSIVVGPPPIENVNVQTVDEYGPPDGPGGVWRIFIIASTYPTLGDTVQIGQTVTTAWGTPVTATILDIQQDVGQWQIHVDQNIVTGFNAGPQTVTFNGGIKTWTFDTDGNLTLPAGGDILDSEGNSVLGGGSSSANNNIWVETFASNALVTNIIQIATSVEYDANGNIFALFIHLIPGENYETYTSVAKLTPTGAVVWQVSFGANLNTDGWGLAYDGVDTVYVAGSTDGPDLDYKFATLTKIAAADGSIVWNKTYDFEADSQSNVVDVDSDDNPIMVGYAYNGTDRLIITTKVDSADGAVIWSRTLDGQGDDEAYGMAVGPTGEVVTIGYTDQFGAIDAAATLYADPVSNVNWTINQTGVFSGFGDIGIQFDVSFTAGVPTFSNIVDSAGARTVDGIVATVLGSWLGGTDGIDNMVVKVATLAANDTDDRMIVVKYAADGTIAWQKAIQFDDNYNCSGTDADIDADGNIYVCGSYDRDVFLGTASAMSLVKFDSNGVKQWSRRVAGTCEDFATSVVVGPDNNLYLSGVTIDNTGEDIIWVVAKYSTTGAVVWQRLIDNTASWTFTGGLFLGQGGGSNIAVGNDYVALSGGFGNLANGDNPTATVVQIDTNGTPFSIGDWALTSASFTGSLDNTASDIVVVNAGKTAGTVTPTVANFVVTDDNSNFLIGTLYAAPGGDNSLVNGVYSVNLGNTGTVTLPAGGTITEGYVTSNPTIQLTPASPDVASQKLVIKGGGAYTYTDNGISINYYNNTAIVGDTLTFYINSATYADQTLYWWIYPAGAGISDPGSGTIVLSSSSGSFSFVLDSDDNEFTVRVSPEDNNYDPANLGVETGLINADAPTFDADHHLHLTTGDLTETSIFLGTDNHNVRTTVNGGIEITTPNTINNVWQFGNDGSLTIPGDIQSESIINIDINLNDSTLLRWQFDTDGTTTLPGAVVNSTVEKTYVDTTIALDLTKSVNKLAIGNYTLADGVEGQIMYLVRQTGATYNAIMINVANARVDGTLYTTIDYYPFDNGSFLNMSTLIFTDGAWQADIGSWD